ncbi:hypothetical protein TcYC6_0117190 [Trypanosoma cruzi]|uniref:C3H1-type domain-containing protein n=2 Tax=Trypanosoma cruzi TaxID=5693 RepID=Q4DPF0_TRYCC|nr:hypothetical protein, conserved [Trypanosoma cruzi]EAN94387.1 hypothetical protein, conserved [Trypanosoma cruzi]KAF5215533.1 hypothetical protein ECC02_011777 [Trypanosoma cruzi]KAF5219451.1 hypothetical protein ECC02_007594 [Trypanosoma cruzi]KAF8292516.1 hypothetical protein TcYC6_0117190 [Trypanosoma cruzi]|eukprot:XP_816238.1 hypothetical protein [Trypanosoma cruzi strain CL Brener]
MQPFGQPQIVQNRGYGGYNAYSHPGYPSQQLHAPAQYHAQSGYYSQYPQGTYNPTLFQNFQGTISGQVNRGRSVYAGGRGGGGYGRGAYTMAMGGDYGRGAFGVRSHRKKPFVGGSLETQREWERQTVCCFFLQGNCKFVGSCRFLHEDDSKRPCQFGAQCRVGHAPRAKKSNGNADDENPPSHLDDFQQSAEQQEHNAAEPAQ